MALWRSRWRRRSASPRDPVQAARLVRCFAEGGDVAVQGVVDPVSAPLGEGLLHPLQVLEDASEEGGAVEARGPRLAPVLGDPLGLLQVGDFWLAVSRAVWKSVRACSRAVTRRSSSATRASRPAEPPASGVPPSVSTPSALAAGPVGARARVGARAHHANLHAVPASRTPPSARTPASASPVRETATGPWATARPRTPRATTRTSDTRVIMPSLWALGPGRQPPRTPARGCCVPATVWCGRGVLRRAGAGLGCFSKGAAP